MGDRSRLPSDLSDDDILTFLVGRINRAVPDMSDIILRCLAQLPNAPVFVSDSHRDHLDIWQKTVGPHLDGAAKTRAHHCAMILHKVMDVRTGVNHARTRCVVDSSGRSIINQRAPFIMPARLFRHYFPQVPLPDRKAWPDSRKGIPVSYYGPRKNDEDRYNDKGAIALDTVIDLVCSALPQTLRDMAQIGQEAVDNHRKSWGGKTASPPTDGGFSKSGRHSAG